MIDRIVTTTTGHRSGRVKLYVVGSRERIIATGLIPASVFPKRTTFREGKLPNDVEFTVERVSDDDSVWDVWLGLPHDS